MCKTMIRFKQISPLKGFLCANELFADIIWGWGVVVELDTLIVKV